ncbi:MAG: TIGR01212 family radical SAM protein [Salinivirgaceae bacterium]|nr:TIGR01212 family radical SAM protein [Salinivirgaceae bacterium]MDD4747412.1 TIGR01212 family radical SAM protein [Salinivirgaceae bacterium]
MDNLLFDINQRFYRYSEYLTRKFGSKVQKISVNTGLSCPNLDGTRSFGGCIYCNNEGFVPSYSNKITPIPDQIDQGIIFFERKRQYQYLAYYQSYTNTHTSPENLRNLLMQSVNHPKIVGIVVSTRPDCVSPEIISVLKEVHQIKPLMVEFGMESSLDRTLKLLNRGHSYEQLCSAVERSAQAGLDVGVHVILGLPGELRDEIIGHARAISKLPVSIVKIHQLQIVKRTKLAKLYREDPNYVQLIGWEDYVEICCDFLEILRSDIAVDRFASQTKPELLEVPYWDGVKNHHITHLVQNRMVERQSYQGKHWE